MNEFRDILGDPLVIGAVVFTIVMMVMFRWFLKKMEMNSAGGADDLADGESAGSLSDAALQSKVGTPRARRLQPARAGAGELNLPELNTATPALAEVGFPADSLAMAGEAAFAKKPEPAKPSPLESAEKKNLPSTVSPLLSLEKPPAAESVAKKPDAPVSGSTEAKPLGTTTLPPLAAATGPLPGATAPEKAPAVPATPEKPVATTGAPAPISKFEPLPPIKPPTAAPLSEPAKPAEPLVSASSPADSKDVKKPNTPPLTTSPEAATSGLIAISKASDAATEPVVKPKEADSKSVTSTEPVKAVEPVKPAEAVKAAEPVKMPEPAKVEIPAPPTEESTSFFSKMMGRPRIFMPPSQTGTQKPEADKVTPTPAAAEAVPEQPAALVGSKAPAPEIPAPAKIDTLTPPVVVPTGSLTAAPSKPVEPAKPAVEPVKPVSVPPAASSIPAPKPVEPVKPETPAKPVDKPMGATDIPAEDGTPSAPLIPEASTSPKPVAPAPAVPAPAKPASSVPALIPSTPANVPPPVPAAPAKTPAVSVTTPPRTMAQSDTTTALPANARAAAQLTLGFEITSLQLTPFFKLGAVQLRPLSNIVSLHLVASAAADNPLAAGISFQIVTVELNEAAHLKSILLKPLPQAQPATVPSQKLQVDNVQITQAGENAPISVTTSETTSTAVQLLADFTIAAMDFTPSFEIGSLRLEPTSNSVLLRLAPSQRPAALDLPPSFEVANVQLGNDAQLSGVRLTPGGTASKPADVKS